MMGLSRVIVVESIELDESKAYCRFGSCGVCRGEEMKRVHQSRLEDGVEARGRDLLRALLQNVKKSQKFPLRRTASSCEKRHRN